MQIRVADRLTVFLKVFEDFERVFLVLSTKESPYLILVPGHELAAGHPAFGRLLRDGGEGQHGGGVGTALPTHSKSRFNCVVTISVVKILRRKIGKKNLTFA